MTEPEMIKIFTDEGESLVSIEDFFAEVPEEKKAPVWASILILLLSAVISMSTLALLVWSVLHNAKV